MTRNAGSAASLRILAPVLVIAVAVAACTAGGAGSTPPGDATLTAPATAAPEPTAVAMPSGGGTAGPAGGGGSAPDPGTGVIVEPPAAGAEPPPLEPEPQPSLVMPVAGLSGIHPVPATSLAAMVDGNHVSAQLAWWSGVEPCSVLAGVDIARDGNMFVLTVHEGSANVGQVACIEIAVYKGTVVDLGELEPGEYTITAFGDPAPVTVTVPG